MGSRRKNRCRKGLRIVGHRGNNEVRLAFIQFANWARLHYSFPVLLRVYLSNNRRLRTIENEIVTASFYYPFNKIEYPFVRVATGDYLELKAKLKRDNALASMLCSLSHELVHYWQWLEAGTTTEAGTAKKARKIVSEYSNYVCRP